MFRESVYRRPPKRRTDAAERPSVDATRRGIYLASHLNMNQDLKSSGPDEFDIVNNDWTMTLHIAEVDVPSAAPAEGGR